MEMCYDGALVMPSRYAVMDSDEMTYVEGGGIGEHWFNKKNFVIMTIDVAVAVATGVSGALSAARAKSIWNSCVLRDRITRAAAAKLSGYIGGAFAKLFSCALTVVSIISGVTMGTIIANALDRVDGKRNDGYIYA